MLSILSKPCRVEEETQGGSSELEFNYCLRQSELQAAEQESRLHIFCRLTLILNLLNYPHLPVLNRQA